MLLTLVMFAMQVMSDAVCGQPDIVCRAAFNGEREPNSAADHVTVRVITHMSGQLREERITVTRSGHRYREDRQTARGRFASYTDLASRLHVGFLRNSAGRYEHLFARRPDPDTVSNRFRRVRTGERDSALGESCDMWATRRLNAHEDESTWLTCLTADGVELWTRIRSRSGLREFSRTVSIERRPVLSSEVTPPRDLFEPSRWEGVVSAARPARRGAGPANGYQVRLERESANAVGSVIRLTIRVRGDWRFEAESLIDGGGRWLVSHAAAGFHFWASRLGSGELHSLQMTRDPSGEAHGDMGGVESLGTTDRVLGETCTWHRRTAFVSHRREEQCLTSDGILLGLRRSHDRGGGSAELRAVSLRRRPPAMASVLPPSPVLSLADWSGPPR